MSTEICHRCGLPREPGDHILLDSCIRALKGKINSLRQDVVSAIGERERLKDQLALVFRSNGELEKELERHATDRANIRKALAQIVYLRTNDCPCDRMYCQGAPLEQKCIQCVAEDALGIP